MLVPFFIKISFNCMSYLTVLTFLSCSFRYYCVLIVSIVFISIFLLFLRAFFSSRMLMYFNLWIFSFSKSIWVFLEVFKIMQNNIHVNILQKDQKIGKNLINDTKKIQKGNLWDNWNWNREKKKRGQKTIINSIPVLLRLSYCFVWSTLQIFK